MLTKQDMLDDAVKIGCEVEVIMAITAVESRGAGFNPDGFPKTLFEAHWFSKLTKGKYDISHPHLSSKTWNRKLYGKTWQSENARLSEACALDRTAALMSASWGLFQIMGFNHALCGHKTVQSFVNAMIKDENSQLEMFTQFIINRGLADELRDKRWADFARLYNGPQYHINKYDQKLEQEYQRLKHQT